MGKILRDHSAHDEDDKYRQSFITAQRWRGQHFTPTEQCFEDVLNCSQQCDQSVATYRLKRMTSIIRKLQRPHTHFKLGELDDIGGCRLIVDTNAEVQEAAEYLESKFSLKNGGKTRKDYILNPQKSGYRSRHILTSIDSESGCYHIEIQIRTKLQHYWATAVEASDEIYGTHYKNQGTDDNLPPIDQDRMHFFAIVSSLFAIEENSPEVPGFTDNKRSLITQLNESDCSKQILRDLKATTDSVFNIDLPQTDHQELFLLKFSRANQYLDIVPFRQKDLREALNQYDALENEIEPMNAQQYSNLKGAETFYDNVVLVFAQNPQQLNIAYPNYSANVNQFVEKVSDYLA